MGFEPTTSDWQSLIFDYYVIILKVDAAIVWSQRKVNDDHLDTSNFDSIFFNPKRGGINSYFFMSELTDDKNQHK